MNRSPNQFSSLKVTMKDDFLCEPVFQFHGTMNFHCLYQNHFQKPHLKICIMWCVPHPPSHSTSRNCGQCLFDTHVCKYVCFLSSEAWRKVELIFAVMKFLFGFPTSFHSKKQCYILKGFKQIVNCSAVSDCSWHLQDLVSLSLHC